MGQQVQQEGLFAGRRVLDELDQRGNLLRVEWQRRDAERGAFGFVLLGLPGAPLAITSAPCFLYLDPAPVAILSAFATTGSTWSMAVPIPNVAALRGGRVALQAVLAPTTAASGFDTTNGIFATLGY